MKRLEAEALQARRSQTQQKHIQAALDKMPVAHFGADVSSFVASAVSQGGSLDEVSRARMYGNIKTKALAGAAFENALPPFIADHITEHKNKNVDVHQNDLRVAPRSSQSYAGHQLTSTRVSSSHGATADDKTIAQPLSPRPSGDSGAYHRAHAAPFSLVGDQSNNAHTVWAPGWANITVDGHIEKQAQATANKGHTVFHFRLDTAKKSTVGFVAERHGEAPPFQSFAAQYERR